MTNDAQPTMNGPERTAEEVRTSAYFSGLFFGFLIATAITRHMALVVLTIVVFVLDLIYQLLLRLRERPEVGTCNCAYDRDGELTDYFSGGTCPVHSRGGAA